MHRHVIFNADDFGRSKSVNAAVVESHEKGVVRSASLMATGLAFDAAAEYARKNGTLDIGVHLTLCDGAPVCDPSEVPSLVKRGGRFQNTHHAFLKRYLRGKISRREIALEFATQIARVRAVGLTVTHLDSHQHLHSLPEIFKIVVRLAEENGIQAVRVPEERAAFLGPMRKTVARLGLWLNCRAARRHLAKSQVRAPDYFVGSVNAGAWNTANLRQTIARLGEGVTEICCHPRFEFAEGPNPNLATTPRDELDALTDPEFDDFLKAENVSVASFAESFRANV